MLTVSILTVDDESFVCENLRLKLKRLNHLGIEYQLSTCKNSSQALELIKKQQFNIIFTDIRMPFFNGISLIQTLRESCCQSKIWVLSGYDDFDTVRAAFLNGADDYLLKPIDIGLLDQKLRAYVSNLKNSIEVNHEPEQQPAKDAMGYAISYIQSHYSDSHLSMTEVAEFVSLSYNHFSTLFRSRTKMTFPAYLLHFRVEKAIELLKDPDLKISDICYKVGFKYPHQFSRDFKKVTGHYPSEYRQKLYSNNSGDERLEP